MKTTIEIPDDLYPTLAAASSAAGVSLEGFVLSAAREKAGDSASEPDVMSSSPNGGITIGEFLADYYARFDALPNEEQEEIRQAAAEVQAIIDEEFSKIDPRDWE